MAERVRANAGLPALDLDAIACRQACALALVEREIAMAEALMQHGVNGSLARADGVADGRSQLPRRAAYLHVLSTTA